MSLGALLHIALHALIPLGVAWLFYRPRWKPAFAILLCGWVIDVDHLLAKPIYAPNRCSIGFHPLHTTPAILIYGAMLVAPQTRVLGLGLSLHIGLDAADCVRMSRNSEPAAPVRPTQ